MRWREGKGYWEMGRWKRTVVAFYLDEEDCWVSNVETVAFYRRRIQITSVSSGIFTLVGILSHFVKR